MLAAQAILLAIKPQYLTETVRNTHVEPILSTKELTSHKPTKERLYTGSIYMGYLSEAGFTGFGCEG
jgi:hypothetical protein